MTNGSAAHRDDAPTARIASSSDAVVMAIIRISLGVLWVVGAGWKTPPDFGESAGRGLYRYTAYAVEYPVFAPYSWVTEHIILEQFVLFGWITLALETALAGFLLVGLATRAAALVGVVLSVSIGLSVALAPHEWPWAYILMVAAHAAVFATAAGRTWGLDGLVREALSGRTGRLVGLVRWAS